MMAMGIHNEPWHRTTTSSDEWLPIIMPPQHGLVATSHRGVAAGATIPVSEPMLWVAGERRLQR
jgi:hypothetical protein